MKKLILILIASTFILDVFCQELDPEVSRWSVMPQFGANYFDGDINQNLTNLFPTSSRDISLGATIEYSMTPVWGLNLDYFYFPLRARNSNPIPIFINTDLSSVCLNATINFTRLVFPQSKSKFYFQGGLGIGFASYVFDVRHAIHNLDGTYSQGTPVDMSEKAYDINGLNNVLLYDSKGQIKTGFAITVPVFFGAEYNFSKPLSVGIKVEYRAFNKDNLEGVTQLNYHGVTNDFVGFGTIFVRYKFRAVTRRHVRNSKVDELVKDQNPVVKELAKIIENQDKKVDSLNQKINELMNGIKLCCGETKKPETVFVKDTIPKKPLVLDSDGDGVPDYLDKCPNTPRGVAVDYKGCPLDSDGDGVPDYLDKCPNTPRGVAVDSNGCPLDRDGDGVPDYLDKCPDVPGLASNKGCPEVKEDVKKVLNLALTGVQFDTDKDIIKTYSYEILNKVVAIMKTNPTYNLEISGHTDNQGGAQHNLDLSHKRTEAVKKYLINHGVEASRLTNKWYGLTMPIASNKTAQGTYKNRRVEFKVTF
jgi:outer membrane protein OmpA-like peptidoglycan-associated protein